MFSELNAISGDNFVSSNKFHLPHIVSHLSMLISLKRAKESRRRRTVSSAVVLFSRIMLRRLQSNKIFQSRIIYDGMSDSHRNETSERGQDGALPDNMMNERNCLSSSQFLLACTIIRKGKRVALQLFHSKVGKA